MGEVHAVKPWDWFEGEVRGVPGREQVALLGLKVRIEEHSDEGRVGRGKVELDVPDVRMVHMGFGGEFGGKEKVAPGYAGRYSRGRVPYEQSTSLRGDGQGGAP